MSKWQKHKIYKPISVTHDPGNFSSASPTKMGYDIRLKQHLFLLKQFQILTLNLIALTFLQLSLFSAKQTKHITSLPEQDMPLKHKIPTQLTIITTHSPTFCTLCRFSKLSLQNINTTSG